MEACIKGQSYNIAKEYIIKQFGLEAFSKILEEMDDRDRDIVSQSLLDISWIPEKTFVNLLNITDKIFGKGDYQVCREIGIYSAKKGISKFYKVFIKIGDPSFVLSTASRFWSQIHNHGRLEVLTTGSNSAVARLYDYETPHKAFCYYLIGYFEGVLEMSGAKLISSYESKCVTQGADCCEFIGKWE